MYLLNLLIFQCSWLILVLISVHRLHTNHWWSRTGEPSKSKNRHWEGQSMFTAGSSPGDVVLLFVEGPIDCTYSCPCWEWVFPLIKYEMFECSHYAFSHNHGFVSNGCIWKITTTGGTHVSLPWLWEEGYLSLLFFQELFCYLTRPERIFNSERIPRNNCNDSENSWLHCCSSFSPFKDFFYFAPRNW